MLSENWLRYPLKYFQRNFKKQISEPVDISLNKATPDMWDKVLSTFKNTLEKAESTYLAKAKSELFRLLYYVALNNV